MCNTFGWNLSPALSAPEQHVAGCVNKLIQSQCKTTTYNQIMGKQAVRYTLEYALLKYGIVFLSVMDSLSEQNMNS